MEILNIFKFFRIRKIRSIYVKMKFALISNDGLNNNFIYSALTGSFELLVWSQVPISWAYWFPIELHWPSVAWVGKAPPDHKWVIWSSIYSYRLKSILIFCCLAATCERSISGTCFSLNCSKKRSFSNICTVFAHFVSPTFSRTASKYFGINTNS